MKIKFKGLGINMEITCEDGASCQQAVDTFKEVTGKALEGMTLYNGTQPIEDLSSDAPEQITAVRAKHASA